MLAWRQEFSSYGTLRALSIGMRTSLPLALLALLVALSISFVARADDTPLPVAQAPALVAEVAPPLPELPPLPVLVMQSPAPPPAPPAPPPPAPLRVQVPAGCTYIMQLPNVPVVVCPSASAPAAPAAPAAAAAPVAAVAAPSFALPRTRTTHYGGYAALADGSVLLLAAATRSPALLGLGFLSGGFVHAMHGNWEGAAGSVGLRLGATYLIAGVVQVACNRSSSSSSASSDSECTGAAVGIGGLMAAATLAVDYAIIAKRTEILDPAPVVAKVRVPRFQVQPTLSLGETKSIGAAGSF